MTSTAVTTDTSSNEYSCHKCEAKDKEGEVILRKMFCLEVDVRKKLFSVSGTLSPQPLVSFPHDNRGQLSQTRQAAPLEWRVASGM